MIMNKQGNILETIITVGIFTWLFWPRKVETISIGGLKGAYRKMLSVTNSRGDNLIINDLKSFPINHISHIIKNGIEKARLQPTLEYPFFKPFVKTLISGEIRVKPYRIFVYRLGNDFLMLYVFIKKKDETDERHIKIAENRLKEWLSQNKKV